MTFFVAALSFPFAIRPFRCDAMTILGFIFIPVENVWLFAMDNEFSSWFVQFDEKPVATRIISALIFEKIQFFLNLSKVKLFSYKKNLVIEEWKLAAHQAADSFCNLPATYYIHWKHNKAGTFLRSCRRCC